MFKMYTLILVKIIMYCMHLDCAEMGQTCLRQQTSGRLPTVRLDTILLKVLLILKLKALKSLCRSTHKERTKAHQPTFPRSKICRLTASEGSRRTSLPTVDSGANWCSKQPRLSQISPARGGFIPP